jgi:hypothetical protein
VRPVSHTIEYDASLTAMGALVWNGDLVGSHTMLCRRASIGFSVLAASIYETRYVSSKDNVVCDGLSRSVHPSQLGRDERLTGDRSGHAVCSPM